MNDSGLRHRQVCDLCGGDRFELISERDRKRKPLNTGLCLGCGLVMHLPVPSESEVAEYYATRYRRDYHGERIPSARRVMRAWKNGERIHRQLAPYLGDDIRSVFEVGAGIGCTVKVFERHGYTARGIEPNTDFNTYSRRRLRADIRNANLYDIDDADQPDLILLIHVIEHFVSPRKALAHIHRLLRDSGLLYIECPNLTAPFATFGRMFHYAHIYNFSHQTLIALARETGFRPVIQFSDPEDPDIQILFRKAEPEQAAAELRGHADEVRAAIRRYNVITYHLRPAYLQRRIKKLAAYLMEFLYARFFVQGLLRGLSGHD